MTWPCPAGIRGARAVAAGAALTLTAAAAGQNQWLFDIAYSDPAGVINSLDDTATVTLWAAFDQNFYAFGRGRLDIIADDPIDAGEWSDPAAILHGPGAEDGVVDGEAVTGIVVFQFHDALAGIYGDTSNPIAAWTATWRTDDLSARSVLLQTETEEFGVYRDSGGDWADLTGVLGEGAGKIKVVPAPGVAPGLFLLAGVRRLARGGRSDISAR